MNSRLILGFTLIEILVVLFIISIVTSVALLSINHNENKQLESIAHELSAQLSLAKEEAILLPAVLGLSVSDHKIQFYRLNLDGQNKSKWEPLNEFGLKPDFIPDDVQVDIENNSKIIVISTNGEMSPFKLFIHKIGKKKQFVVMADESGTVKVKHA